MSQLYKYSNKQLGSTNYYNGAIRQWMKARYKNGFTKKDFMNEMKSMLQIIRLGNITEATCYAKGSTGFSYYKNNGVIVKA